MASRNQWELFGFDLRYLAQAISGAWRSVFLDYHSPVRKFLDVDVSVLRLSPCKSFEGSELDHQVDALVFPESQILVKKVVLPRAALFNIGQIVQSEMLASSPFLPEDTVRAIRVNDEGEKAIELWLAIASRTIVMSKIHQVSPSASVDDYEVWAEVEADTLVFEGFGEHKRNLLYKKRLMAVLGMSVASIASLVVLMALPMVYQYDRLEKTEELLNSSRQEAVTVMTHRAELLESNSRLRYLQDQLRMAAQPLMPLKALSVGFGDDSWLAGYEHFGSTVKIDAYSDNAANLIKQLTDGDEFTSVKPTSAIRQVGRNDIDRVRLELKLSGDAGGSR
ncbi:hypothetical protein [Gilvimarinus xylanilyticus]|uniref:General secretion pathway protein L n=1 Tax=Gilvimarinus xylanilyticus TaxID=2944139 RepID=A0A9X2I3K7_9GAMM|nr:hypothetical protein [Gilvimarinus xylanilyticus]MCP8899361.1 hypothetical protein [Gilvimarinus xylanilyticus]